MYCWQETIVDEFGQVRPNAGLEVRDAATLELVEIFEDAAGRSALDNPFRGRAGFCRFYAAAGRYQITALDDDLERVWANVLLGFTLETLPDLTGVVTAIVNARLAPVLADLEAQLDALPHLTFFSVLGDGTSPDIPEGWTSERLGPGEYRVTVDLTGGYNVKLQVFDASSDRVASAMMVDEQEDFFDYRVRSIHDEASASDARVDVEVTHALNEPPEPSVTYQAFTESAPFFIPDGVTSIDILMVGGGGGGGGRNVMTGGGGGGGAVQEFLGVTVAPGDELSVTVGGGGSGAGTPVTLAQAGAPSDVYNVTPDVSLGQVGGGGAGEIPFDTSDGSLGSSGGGGAENDGGTTPPGSGDGSGNDGGVAFQGVNDAFSNIGGASGGGGGAGTVGGNGADGVPGNGGNGVVITGWGIYSATYGGGGAGAGWGAGGEPADPVRGTRGTGGGAAGTGGGGSALPDFPDSENGEPGFSGLVVLRYATPP